MKQQQKKVGHSPCFRYLFLLNLVLDYLVNVFVNGQGSRRIAMGISVDLWRARIGRYFPGTHRGGSRLAAIFPSRTAARSVRLVLALVFAFVVLPYARSKETMCTDHWLGMLIFLPVLKKIMKFSHI